VTQVRLGDRAHCRFGDKGDVDLFVVAPFEASDFDALAAVLTPECVGDHLGVPADRVRCTPCPRLGALVIAVRTTARGDVTASLALDAHGKSLSGHLLAMPVPWPVSQRSGTEG
jgi:hypothetical protein